MLVIAAIAAGFGGYILGYFDGYTTAERKMNLKIWRAKEEMAEKFQKMTRVK